MYIASYRGCCVCLLLSLEEEEMEDASEEEAYKE